MIIYWQYPTKHFCLLTIWPSVDQIMSLNFSLLNHLNLSNCEQVFDNDHDHQFLEYFFQSFFVVVNNNKSEQKV